MRGTCMICFLSVTGLWAANNTSEIAKQRAAASYGKLPLSFERNEGQTDSRVRFLARGRGYGLFLTRREAVLSLASAEKGKRAVLRVGLGHAAAGGTDPVGVDALAGKSSYFVGKDPSQWHSGVSNYAAVKYAGVYPGIDLVYHGNQGQLEYDFDVAPGADPRRIELRFSGARQLRINQAGDLVVGLGGSELVEHRPVVYQEVEGKRELVAGSYVLRGRDRVGFRLGEYDRSRAVVIDPTLVYSTYLGGSGVDIPDAIAIDAAGNAYITGQTESADFPFTRGAFQPGCDSCAKAFVTKLNVTGSALIYSAYLSGSTGLGIAVDAAGNAYVTGSAGYELPVTAGAFQTSFDKGDCTDCSAAFVTKLNATGSALIYSTFLGGSGDDYGNSIATDSTGNAYVTGPTDSADFPVTVGAFQTSSRGYHEAFVTKLNVTGTALLYSTFLGGSGGDYGRSIAIDKGGNAYLFGDTSSTDFPVTPGALQTSPGSIFVTKVNTTGTALLYSTYIGGTGSNVAGGIAIDAAENAYITGTTGSTDFPVTPGAFQTSLKGPVYNAFVTKLNATGSALLYSTYLGAGHDSGYGIAVDSAGAAYVAGYTSFPDFPVTPDAFQSTTDTTFGFGDAFLTKLDATGSTLLYSTRLGGNYFEYGSGIAVDTVGSAYVTGLTLSADFPVTPGVFQSRSPEPSGYNGFVFKLNTTKFGPLITLVGVVPGPPKQVQFQSQDQQSGLATIQVLECINCTATTESFTSGTTDPVMTTATKTDQTKGSIVQIEATDLAGNATFFDPTDITIQADGRAEVQLVRISGLEHVVMITNGTPGVRAIVLRVRGKDVPVLALKDGETRTVDIKKELVAGRSNDVTVLSWGPRGASASVVFTQP